MDNSMNLSDTPRLVFHTRSDDTGINELPLVEQFIFNTITEQYINLALLTVLAYYSTITFDQEVKYFWPNPRSSVSLIYFANRYLGLLGAICNVTSKVFNGSFAKQETYWNLSDLGSMSDVIYAAAYFRLGQLPYARHYGFSSTVDILLTRVLAFFQGGRKIALCLKMLLAFEGCVGITIVIFGNATVGLVIGDITESISICGARGLPNPFLVPISWSIPMMYGLVLLSLALYKSAEYWRSSSGFKGIYLVKVCIRDQSLYYAIVVLCCVFKIISSQTTIKSVLLRQIFDCTGSPTLLCVLGSQLLINLKEAGEREENGGTVKTRTVSEMEFA